MLYSAAVSWASWARVENRSGELRLASETDTAHSDSPFHNDKSRCPNIKVGKLNGDTLNAVQSLKWMAFATGSKERKEGKRKRKENKD